jgi:uncharacterized protein (UPF0261 family)
VLCADTIEVTAFDDPGDVGRKSALRLSSFGRGEIDGSLRDLGVVAGVVQDISSTGDLAPGGVGEHLFGFMRDAGPFRLENAGRLGIPLIVSTCSVNHMTPSKSRYQPEYHQRRKYDLDKFRTWIRLSPEELKEVAHVFAVKLNKATGPVKVLVPQNGWSSVDQAGNATHDPQEDRMFVETLQKKLHPDIDIVEVQANMEDLTFAQAVVKAALALF